ncbi:cysteine desulfurase family protein, partial [Leucobacter sp. M11]|uniref:cysteine desulfurase family protein n=1 Tax=Leucobacter sp. M11 TaxID=2993565 RepID=UPI002D811389
MRVYLDHAATTPMPERVAEVYLAALRDTGNPASTHEHGRQSRERLETARATIAGALGCEPVEVVLTSGGTESVNLALKGLFWARQRGAARPVLLIAAGEHHATVDTVEWLAAAQGAELVWLPLDAEGRLRPEVLSAALAAAGPERVALISFLWGNNEVGTVQAVTELAEIARNAGVPAHADAVAALGQLPIDFAATGLSALSVSAHKVGGPVGVGALVLGRAAQIDGLVHGGNQQRGRSGTQDVAGAVAFAAALRDAPRPGGGPDARLAELRDELISGVRLAVPDAVLRGPDPASGERLPGNAHFTFPGCQGDSLLFLLDHAGVSVSTGSACQAGVAEVSHVLLAMGLDEATAIGALRFTLGHDSSRADIEALCREL